MSIVTLKKKTMAQYNNNSVNTGFSLNGTHRNQGYIGQTSLSRSFPRTPMKGNVAKGHGGCCGAYPTGNIIQSGVTSLEDSNVVKLSTANTLGLISTKYRWVRRPQPYSTTQKTIPINSQSDYIDYVQRKTLTAKNADGGLCNESNDPKEYKYNATCGGLTREQQGYRTNSQIQINGCKKIVGVESKTGAIDQSQYLTKLDNTCVEPFSLPKKTGGTPFGCHDITN